MRKSYLAAIMACGLVLPGCGDQEPLPAMRRREPRVEVSEWNIGDDLAARKRVVVDTVRGSGKSESVAALVLAVGMGETERFSAAQRDTSKDGAGAARNFSAFNLNLDFLQSVHIDGAAAERLNDDANLPDAVRAILSGIDKYGEDKFLNFHRGGCQGRDDGVSYGCGEYRQAIRCVQARIQGDKSLFSDGRRVGMYIPHV